MNCNLFHRNALSVFTAVIVVCMMLTPGCSREPAWKSLNDRVIKENNIEVRSRDDIPETGVVSNLVPGEIINKNDLPDVMLSPGVKCKMYWGKGVLVNWMTMEPGAEIPNEKLSGERIMVVWKGSADQLINGKFVTMRQFDTVTNWSSTPHRDFVYLRKGAENAVKAGQEGAEILEIYWPVRLDYVKKAGGKVPAKHVVGNYDIPPSFPPDQVFDLYDVQFTNLSRMTANSKIISGQGVQCGFLDMDPERKGANHAHPEEQLSICLVGSLDEIVMGSKKPMKEGDILYLPGNMVHRGENHPNGYDMLDVFWPPRQDYAEKMNDRLSRFHEIIPEDAKPMLVHDGIENEPHLTFTEGPSWMDGKLFFSNMWFAKGFTSGSPEKSNFIRMERDGTLKVISSGMQTNGTMPLGNGNLAVCDMFGHRVIEMTPNGKVLRTLASKCDGVRVDGPNDLVIDAKGGIYFTDPQFTPGLDKTQPGKAVYYRRPDGNVIRVIEHGEFGLPNGILLSPDGKTCYINNTNGLPPGRYVMAFDVNEDGTLTNGRKFAKLFITPEIRNRGEMGNGADGMTIDVHGNIYVTTLMGIQIFDRNGEFIGIVNLPMRPISCVFGGDDMQTIYCTCVNRIYSIRTNVRGLQYPLK